MNAVETSPRMLSSELASQLNLTKREWIASSPVGQIRQTGGGYIGGSFDVPTGDADSSSSEPAIETFVVDGQGACQPTGTNQRLIDLFLPAATQMASRVLTALRELGVTIISPAYLTASITAPAIVTTTPHFDDDQYVADDGVGVVAIAASGAGPKIAAALIPCEVPRRGLPVALEARVVADFLSRSLSLTQAAANRIVVFPQFGQLHSGPDIARLSAPRSLLVLRAATQPTRG